MSEEKKMEWKTNESKTAFVSTDVHSRWSIYLDITECWHISEWGKMVGNAATSEDAKKICELLQKGFEAKQVAVKRLSKEWDKKQEKLKNESSQQ